MTITVIDGTFADPGTYSLAQYLIHHLVQLRDAQLSDRKEFAHIAIELEQLRRANTQLKERQRELESIVDELKP